MRSHNILRKSQLLRVLRQSTPSNPLLLSSSRPSCLLRMESKKILERNRSTRPLSTYDAAGGVSTDSEPITPEHAGAQGPLEASEKLNDVKATSSPVIESESSLSDELSKVKIRRTRVAVPSKDSENVELPHELDILWLPEETTHNVDSFALPPPEVFEEAMNNLLIALHPQIQHRATYPPGNDPPIEPTFGLYCPIEGGDYIVDATVREMARQVGAEVLVLDAVQLAGGEWGQFGKAANALELPLNPLHFASSTDFSSNKREDPNEDEDEDPDVSMFPAQHMKLTVLTPTQGRAIMSSSRRPVPRSKVKVFFDTLINSTPSKPISPEGLPSSSRSRPRIIYIRDFPMLSATSSAWYPPLLSAVKQRRRGPISKQSSAVPNPMTIIFGITPPLTPPASHGTQGPNSNLMNYLMSRNSSTSVVVQGPKQDKFDWSESDTAEKARERRLMDRLKRWGKNEMAFLEEFPKLTTNGEEDSNDSQKPDLIFNIGPGAGIASRVSQLLSPTLLRSDRGSDADGASTFFRSSILLPRVRSYSEERATRVARRREINELSIRMGVGEVGGAIDTTPAHEFFESPPDAEDSFTGSSPSPGMQQRMWEEWGNKIEVWADVQRIANNAVGSILSPTNERVASEKTNLDSTIVPWTSIQLAWAARKNLPDLRKIWMKDVSSVASKPDQAEAESSDPESETVDEIIESIKNDSELEPHEQRLLGCIVNSATMPTSFSQVHLAPHIIDSVRTIVSLPLLHPRAFQQGILKLHGMTGCLLFGPPGTGKTLLVRALAKEAGCRMLSISPSDVVDMYVGEGEKLVKAVFTLARRLSPCVVFLDEIDALFGARMSARESGGAIAHRGIITEFMQEMDGLKSSRDDGVIIIGATNRPFDLDDAVLRRLPRRLLVDLPGEKEREEILKILLRDEALAPDVSHHLLAQKTESFSGSDLKHLCVSAALDAVKERVHVPWNVTSSTNEEDPPPADPGASALASSMTETQDSLGAVTNQVPKTDSINSSQDDKDVHKDRVLHLRNFTKALKEITPSSSESLGTLADLRKWNEEFGEGHRGRKNRQVWGKGRFGFVDDRGKSTEEGRVAAKSSFLPSEWDSS